MQPYMKNLRVAYSGTGVAHLIKKDTTQSLCGRDADVLIDSPETVREVWGDSYVCDKCVVKTEPDPITYDRSKERSS